MQLSASVVADIEDVLRRSAPLMRCTCEPRACPYGNGCPAPFLHHSSQCPTYRGMR